MATYGEGTGGIAFGSVDCQGSEESLFDCPMLPINDNITCTTHANDASVVCAGRLCTYFINFVTAPIHNQL